MTVEKHNPAETLTAAPGLAMEISSQVEKKAQSLFEGETEQGDMERVVTDLYRTAHSGAAALGLLNAAFLRLQRDYSDLQRRVHNLEQAAKDGGGMRIR